MNIDRVRESPLGLAYESVEDFVDTTDAQRLLIALWAAHTHVYRRFDATPRLSFVAEEPGAGKSVALNVALSLSSNPLSCGYVSQAAIYCWLQEHPDTTLGLDEIDKVFGVDGGKTSRPVFAQVVNDGYTSQGTVMIVRSNRAVQVPVFAPVATAGLGHLPEDTRTRALEIRLRAGTPAMAYISERYSAGQAAIGGDLARWLGTRAVRDTLDSAAPYATVDGTPRFKQIMAPLQAVAVAAGLAEEFAAAITEWRTGDSEEPEVPMADALRSDVEGMLTDKIITAAEIIDRLPSKWKSIITDDQRGTRTLAKLLRSTGIESIKSNGQYGYRRQDHSE